VWHVCNRCIALIMSEEWDVLIDRIVAAYAALQLIPQNQQAEFRHELTLTITKNYPSHNDERMAPQ